MMLSQFRYSSEVKMHNISSHKIFCINEKNAIMNSDSLHHEIEVCYHNKIFMNAQIVTTAQNTKF